MRILTRASINLLLLLSAFSSIGQTTEDRIDNLRNVVPPSPNASSLGKYGEWPVSLYTGLPSIDIPIYTVKGRQLSVPLSLSYHSAGHKVGDVASWVGLGWTVNGGGMISRSVRGWPDEDPSNGYFVKRQLYTNQNDICSYPVNQNSSVQHKVAVAKGQADGEQDIYSFNALGKSFKFFFKGDGTIVPTPYNKVKITTNFGPSVTVPENVSWTALFEDGTKLIFGGQNFLEVNTNPRFDIGSSYFATAWVLKSITSPTGEVVNFSYTTVTIDQDSYYSESDYIKVKTSTLSNGYGGCNFIDDSPSKRSKMEHQQVTMTQISTIENDLVRVDFFVSTDQRSDLQGSKSLSNIKVYSKSENQYIDQYNFNYTYSQCAAGNSNWAGVASTQMSYFEKRLQLTSLERTSLSTTEKQVWSFEYNPLALPSRRSFAQDHWGFYNGLVNNNTLLPNYYYTLPMNASQSSSELGFWLPKHDVGVNRDGNGQYAQAEMLQSITYPTGGKTTFYFEGNVVPVTEEIFNEVSVNTAINLNSLSNPYTALQNISFTTTVPQIISLSLDAYITAGIFNDRPNARISASIFNSGGQSVSELTYVNNGQQNLSAYINIYTPGTYTLRLSTNVTQESFGNTDAILGTAYLTYQQSLGIQNVNKNVGGLRIKKMVTTDNMNPLSNSEKTFVYENPFLINPIDIKKQYFTVTEERTCNPQSGAVCEFDVITRNSSTKFALGDIQGGTVGYENVTTVYGVNGSNGKTVSEFASAEDQGAILSVEFPYPPTDSREWRRGLLLKQTDFTSNNIKIKEIANVFDFANITATSSFTAGITKALPTSYECTAAGFGCIDANGDCFIQKVCYNTTSEQVNHTSTTETMYDQAGLNPLATTTNYYFDNPANVQATRIETTNSKGETIKIIHRTPLEKTAINSATSLTTTASAAIDEMLVRNMVSPVLQTEKWKVIGGNSTLLSRSMVNYKQWTSTLLEPENVQVQQLSNPLETRVQFMSYDVSGNLLDQQKANDLKQSYLYGYNKTYPVAQVIGSDYATISALVNQSVLDYPSSDAALRNELNNLRIGLALTKVLITTYTYKPLIGVTSQTDPSGRAIYYEYDSFGRLLDIKDQNGKVLKKNDYKYASQ